MKTRSIPSDFWQFLPSLVVLGISFLVYVSQDPFKGPPEGFWTMTIVNLIIAIVLGIIIGPRRK